MNRRLFLSVLLPALLAPAGGSASESKAVASPSPYTVTDLGTLGGATTKAMGVTENSLVVGASQSGSYMSAFLWDDGTLTNLGDLGGQGSWAYDVNDAGQVVGGSHVASGDSHAFLWQNSSMHDLGTLGGPSSYAFDVNSSGHAVGNACCAPDTYLSHAVLWGSAGIVDLGDLDPAGPAISAAYGVNDAGQVVGGSYDASANFHAFLWQGGAMQDLGTLGGDFSEAEAINASGQVVGVARLANGTPHAFLWDGGMQDLGALTWDQSIAYDINDDTIVVGALSTGQTSHAFLWKDGQMVDLNTLIPADSGWVLSEARAINNRGQIVGFGQLAGQTRAFLLKPAFRWVNPAGGSWYLSSNWDPPGIPGAGDTVVFGLSGQYSVDTTPVFSGDSPTTGTQADQMLVESTNTVDFHGLVLDLLGDSPADPGLKVGEGATVNIHSGSGAFVHGALGVLPPAVTNPPPARLQVFNSGTTLTGTGGLTIGDRTPGDLFVANGGHLTTAEARLGGGYPPGTGTALVSGDGSLWETGNIAVGHGFEGTLRIENGGRVNSNDAFVSFGFFSMDSQVIVDGVGAVAGQPSMWALLGSLTVGEGDFGSVEVLNGGDLYVSQDIYVKNGEVNAEGRTSSGNPSDLFVLGSVFVGGAGTANLLALRSAAKGEIEGDLIIGRDGAGAAILWGTAVVSDPTWLDVVDPQAGLCAIGRAFDGGVSLDDRGLFRCTNIEVGGRPGMNGSGYLTVDGGMVRALDVLTVGHVGGGIGVVDMSNDALVATNGTYISANGAIFGLGTLAVGFLGLVNDGWLSPLITVQGPLASATPDQPPAKAQSEPATLAVDGTLTMGPGGGLRIPLTGSLPGQYGSLAVTGAATLDGVLALDFENGYAPRRGDTFTLLTAEGGTSGSFASVEVSGLRPGFELEITYVDGQVALLALNDGVPDDFIAAGFSWTAADLGVSFTNTTTGTEPITYAWDFGDGAASTEVSPAHSYAEPGIYAVTLTASNVAGNDTATHQVEVGMTPSLDELYFVAAAANAAGAAGSFFVTDLEINNAGMETISYQLLWLPRGSDNSNPAASEVYTLAAGASVRYENVLNQVFAADNAVGALAIAADSESAIVMSRTFNQSAGGTFGQGLPAIHSDQLIPSARVERITFMSENDDIRANLGCVNGLDTPLRIDIEIHDAAGALLELTTMDLGPWSNNQINRIFRGYAPVNGYVDVSTQTVGAAFFCYGSVLDNSTSDPTTVLPQTPSDATIFVPAAALAAGLEGAFFETDLDLNNAGSAAAEYRLGWLPRGADNTTATLSAPFTLAAGASVRYENVLDSVFGLEPDRVGALVVEADSEDLLAMSRTYNLPTGKVAGTFGQELPGIPAGSMIPAGEKRRIIFMNENDDVRSNVGCQNAGLDPATVTIELHSSTGEVLGTRTMALPPLSNDQLTRVFRSYAPIAAGYVDVWTDTAGASIYCYGSVLDNRTSDPTTVLPQ